MCDRRANYWHLYDEDSGETIITTCDYQLALDRAFTETQAGRNVTITSDVQGDAGRGYQDGQLISVEKIEFRGLRP